MLVNAADASHLARPSAPAQGGSAIWEDFRREPHRTARRAGHGPWSAYRLAEAAEGEEVLYATGAVAAANPHFHDITRHNPQMLPWYAAGARAICAELGEGGASAQEARAAAPAGVAGAPGEPAIVFS